MRRPQNGFVPLTGEESGSGPSRAAALIAWTMAAMAVLTGTAGVVISAGGGGEVPFKSLIIAVAIAVLGALLAAARPRALLGWLFLGAALAFGTSGAATALITQEMLTSPGITALAVWHSDRFGAVVIPLGTLALTLLPDSRLPSPRWRAPVVIAVLVQAILVAIWSFSRTPAAGPHGSWPEAIAALENPFGLFPAAWAEGLDAVAWLLPVPMVLSVAAMIARLRSSRGQERSRLVMMVLALAALVGAIIAGQVLWAPVADTIEAITTLLFAVVLISAVLRRQIEGVSVAVHYAFVSVVLGGVVVALYVVSVGALTAAGPELSRFGSGVIAALAALAVLPLRSRLQRWVHRLMYGDVRDPFKAVTRLVENTHGAPSIERVLGAIAASTVTSLRAVSVRVEAFGVHVVHPPGGDTAIEHGPSHHADLLSGERIVGSITVSLQPRRELKRDEQRLIAELGRHAGIAVDSVHLAEQVADHHRAVITAREEERRHLGRELHDGVGPTVAGLSMQLGVLRPLVHSDPDAVVARLAKLEQTADSALDDIRRVAHGLRPPVLDQLGLAESVQQMADSMGLVGVAESVMHGPLPAAVEVAAYRICSEALANIARHSGTLAYRLRIQDVADCLVLVVEDDGVGPEVSSPVGLGLSTMRERAQELGGTLTIRAGDGGGTVVTAVLPLSATKDPTTSRGRA
jgi:two-component system, NarL family, sensor kinase